MILTFREFLGNEEEAECSFATVSSRIASLLWCQLLARLSDTPTILSFFIC